MPLFGHWVEIQTNDDRVERGQFFFYNRGEVHLFTPNGTELGNVVIVMEHDVQSIRAIYENGC